LVIPLVGEIYLDIYSININMHWTMYEVIIILYILYQMYDLKK